MPPKTSRGESLFASAELSAAIDNLITLVQAAGGSLEPRPAQTQDSPTGDRVASLRGRPLFFPTLVSSGLGRGALVECEDGAVRYDFITGIGVHFFGHSDPDLLRAAAIAALHDIVHQGNLQPNNDYANVLQLLLDNAPKQLTVGWLATSGAGANENALKVCRAAKHPAHMLVAFEHCFAGRTTTMAEITDNPSYRRGQVVHGDVLYIPFYDPEDPKSTRKSVDALRVHLQRYPDKICAMMVELVQGEGGFNGAPPAFFEALMKECREAGVLVWVDEIQTFGRTTELYATHALGLDELVDIITVGKMLQNAATLYTEELNPAPGLLSGTFAGTTVGLAVGKRMVTRLLENGHFGIDGRHAAVEAAVLKQLAGLAEGSCRGNIASFGAIGTMVWVMPFTGEKTDVLAVIRAAYERGVVTFLTGHGPFKVRMLLPGGVITDDEIEDGLNRLGEAIQDVAKTRGK